LPKKSSLKEVKPMSNTSTVTGSCHHDCPDTCAWVVEVDDGRAVRLRGADDHPFTVGQLCPKVNRFLDRVYHPDRLLRPMRRVGPKGSGRFEPITWDEALDDIAGRLDDLRNAGRAESVLQFSFDGTQGVIQKGILADRFFDTFGASDIARHLCGTTAGMGAADVYGAPFGVDPEQMSRAKTIVLWGTDTMLTNRHLWPTIDRARSAGAVVVVIDPVRTATAQRADEFFQIRPGADVALVLTIVHVLERDGLLDDGWLKNHTSGWPELQSSARPWHPQRGAEATGIAAERIEWLAHRLAVNGPAAIRTLVGPEHRHNGRSIMRAVSMLPAVTGAFRDVGGGLVRSTQIYFEEALNYPIDRPARRKFNMARLGEILTDPDLDPPIEALVVHNSNPAVIVPDQNRIITGLERNDLFTVVMEQFMTDTARYADIVLPATTQIEHLDLGIAWGHLHLSLNKPAVEPLGEALPNTEIFRRLAARLGFNAPELAESDEVLIRRLLDSDHPWLDGITYELLEREGWTRLRIPVDHRPYVDDQPRTEDAKLHLGELVHEPTSDRGPLAVSEDAYPLGLISRKQHPKFLNANYGGFAEHLPTPPVPRVDLHPDDAEARGVTDGAQVRVHNELGVLTLSARISTDTQPGLVTIPFGWWHDATPENRGVNALTRTTLPDDEQGSAFFHDTMVEVELAATAETAPTETATINTENRA